ncbi:MAG TPA: hypothetical protein VF062_14385 [Candidatus Limnocylindrales bacterium]
MPNDSASRYGPVDDSTYQGFHTYATSDLYDTNGGSERWPDNWASSGPPDSPSDDAEGEEPPAKRDYWSPLLWTMAWYGVPAVVLVLRALLRPTRSEQTRSGAMGDLIVNAPLWVLALVGGLVLALVLRWASETWRAATIGFCAAVVSGGAVTVLYRIW